MKFKTTTALCLAAAIAAAPLSPASAHGRDHRGGPLLLPFVAVAAVVTGAALIATAPFRAVANAPYAQGPYYAPQPAAYASPYQAYPVYYQRPAPQYYAAPVAYYPPPRYYYYR